MSAKKAGAKEVKKSGMAWFRTWAVGNGGMECFEEYEYLRTDMDKDDFAYHIEARCSPCPSGIRSFNWEMVKVKDLPAGFIQEKIDLSKSWIKYYKKHIEELKAML